VTYWFYYLVKWILWVFFHLGFGLEVRGQDYIPKTGPFILASNHVSFLDPPLLGAACPRRLRFMARADLFGKPLLAAFMRGVHVIPLKRGEGDLNAIRTAVQLLHHGEAIAMFPEGGRQLSGQLGVARRGVGLLAMSAEVPVIPVFVHGTFEALGAHATRLSGAKIRVAFGPPIPYTKALVPSTGTGDAQPMAEAGDRARRALHERLAEIVTHEWRRLAASRTST